MAKPFAWDEAAVESLKAMLADEMSASEIAVALVVMSRNAVIGKVHRLGLSFARSHGQREVSTSTKERPARQKPAAAPKPARVPSAPKPPRIAPAFNLPKDPDERREVFCAIADKANDRFNATSAAVVGADNPGVLFLERGLFQCAMPMAGWDEAPVQEKRVCGRPVKVKPREGLMTSYCPACSRLVYAPAGFREFKERSMGEAA